MQRMGSAEGRSPFAGGTGVSPVFGFTTPFLARKGDGGMVERAEWAPTLQERVEVLRQSPLAGRGAGGWSKRPQSADALAAGMRFEVDPPGPGRARDGARLSKWWQRQGSNL